MRYSAIIISVLAATAFASEASPDSQDVATATASERQIAFVPEPEDLEVKKGVSGGSSASVDDSDDEDVSDVSDDSDVDSSDLESDIESDLDSDAEDAAGLSARVSGVTVSAVALAAACYIGIF